MKATRTEELFATARKSLAAVTGGSHHAPGFMRGTFMFWAVHARNPHGARKVRGQQGFTLLELLVVLGILALLATFAAPQVLRYLGKARSETAKLQINAISLGRPYQYRSPGRNGTFEVFTLGRENAPGGVGEDQEISN